MWWVTKTQYSLRLYTRYSLIGFMEPMLLVMVALLNAAILATMMTEKNAPLGRDERMKQWEEQQKALWREYMVKKTKRPITQEPTNVETIYIGYNWEHDPYRGAYGENDIAVDHFDTCNMFTKHTLYKVPDHNRGWNDEADDVHYYEDYACDCNHIIEDHYHNSELVQTHFHDGGLGFMGWEETAYNSETMDEIEEFFDCDWRTIYGEE